MRRFQRSIAIVATLLTTIVTALPSRAGETLTLDEAIGRALEIAPRLANAPAARDLSPAPVDEAHAPLLPDIGAAGDYSQSPGYEELVTNGGQTLAQLVLGYTVYDGGRRSDRLRAARYASEAAMLGEAAVRAQIVFDATVAYFDLVRARGQESHLNTNLDRLGGVVAIAATRGRTATP